MTINEAVSALVTAREREKALKKEIETLSALIKDHAGSADTFVTDDFTVIMKTTISNRLDTKALYKDFPDIKDVYNRPTTSMSIVIAERTESDRISA